MNSDLVFGGDRRPFEFREDYYFPPEAFLTATYPLRRVALLKLAKVVMASGQSRGKMTLRSAPSGQLGSIISRCPSMRQRDLAVPRCVGVIFRWSRCGLFLGDAPTKCINNVYHVQGAACACSRCTTTSACYRSRDAALADPWRLLDIIAWPDTKRFWQCNICWNPAHFSGGPFCPPPSCNGTLHPGPWATMRKS